jgi:hypothetical protein
MNSLRLIFLFLMITNISFSQSKSLPDKQWFKGNLHTHSYWSDGDEFPEVIMDWYKSKDYQFVALTEHNTLAEGEKWKTISPDSIYQKAFRNYLDQYGENWVTYKKDSLNRTLVKLKTYEEYKGLFEESGKFLVIQSEEISDHFEKKPIHLNATNVKNNLTPQGGNSVLEVLQNNINAVLEERDRLNIPMIVHVNHPNFIHAISLADLIGLENERFFEVYNGHHMVHNSGDSLSMPTELMWDYINIAYLQNDKPLMFGLATDDSHNYHVKGRNWSNAGRGWIMVHADALNPKSLIEAMEEGDFYASTGVDLKSLKLENNRLSIEVKKEKGVNYQISFIGCKKGQTEPEVLKSLNGNKATFELTDETLFVRAKIVSTKLHENPIEDLIYESAWTQPVLPNLNK